MNVAEDVVLRACAGHGEEKLLAAQVPVQVGISRTVGDEEIDIGRNNNRSLQIRPCWDAVELDAVELYSFVLQIDNSLRNQIPCPNGLLVKDAVVVAWHEYPKFGGNGRVPSKEVLQVGRIEAFASIPGTDDDVGIGWYGKAPIHPVCVGEGEDSLAFEVNNHSPDSMNL